MKHKNLFRAVGIFLLALLLMAVMVASVAGQEPEVEGDVEAQLVGFHDFLWNPEEATVSKGNGTVVTRLNIEGAEDIFGMTLAIAYDSSIVSPEDVRPGSLLPGTENVDYLMTVVTGGEGLICGDSSFTVHIVYLDPEMTINQSGSLIEITWRSDPAALVGEIADICLDGENSVVVDNGPFPGPDVPDTFGEIEVEAHDLFKFQIGLEGGKNSGEEEDDAIPDPVFTEVTINGLYPCDGGEVDDDGYCAFNNPNAVAPYTIEVSRHGYLDAVVTFDEPSDSSSVFLLAGDINNDNRINILDLYLMASLFGDVEDSTNSYAADYTGPGHDPDWEIDMLDFVLVAKNFGKSGPTDGTPSGGSFPF